MIRTLVVDDERLVAEAHAAYVERLDGFTLAGVALSLQDAARHLRQGDVDLVLLDMNLPDGHGLDLLRRLRAAGAGCDVVALTAARDVAVVRDAVALGVVAYLIKPFTFEAVRERLEGYRTFRERTRTEGELDQGTIDLMMRSLLPEPSLPKGLSPETLRDVVDALGRIQPASAGEVATALGASRVTARRYLEHLAESGRVTRATRLGRAGRPEVEYGAPR